MKNLALIAALIAVILFLTSCSQTTKEPSNRSSPVSAPHAEIEVAVREYVTRGQIGEFLGVTSHRQTDDYYLAGADVRRPENGGRVVIQLIVRRYQKDGTQYWLAERFNKGLVDDLKKR